MSKFTAWLEARKSAFEGTRSDWLTSHHPLPREAVQQLGAMLAAYRRREANDGTPIKGTDQEIADLTTLYGTPDKLWWTDLAQAEICLFDRMTEPELRAELASSRRRMHDVLGDVRYAAYLATAVDITKAPPDGLRADLSTCVRAVYYFYSQNGLAARSRSDVTLRTMRNAAVLIVLELIAIAIVQPRPDWVPHWPTVIGLNSVHVTQMLLTSIAAVVGSVVSVQDRLQRGAADGDPVYRYIQGRDDGVSLAVMSPLLAAIFGCAMYGLVASGYIAQPALKIGDTPLGYGPLALLLILGFVAGFAERLVPDILTRIAAQVTPAAPAAPPAAGTQLTGTQTTTPKPVLTKAEGASGEHGVVVTIAGTGLGTAPGQVQMDGTTIDSPGHLTWTPVSIAFDLPAKPDGGTWAARDTTKFKVVTAGGAASNDVTLTH